MKPAIFLLFAALAAAQEPAMFRGNPAHSGVYPAGGEFKTLQWKFQTGGKVFSSPAVAGGVVYFGSYDQNLYAVEAAGGKLKWKFASGGAVLSSPAVAGGRVYFGSYDGRFYALDAQTGQLKWKFQTEGERRFEAHGVNGLLPSEQVMPDLWDCYQSSPAIANGVVYFGSGDGKLYALDAETGAMRWRFATHGVVHSSPAVAGGVVYFGSWDTFFYAVDAASGEEKWRFKTGEDSVYHNQTGIQSSPAVGDGIVYFGCRDAHLYAVDIKTGKQVWKVFNNGSWVITSPAVRDGLVYYGTSDTALFLGMDAKTGEQKFKAQAGMFVFSSPALAGGMAYFGAFDGKLYSVDLKSGAISTIFQTEASRKVLPEFLGADGKVDFRKIFRSQYWEENVMDLERLHSVGGLLSSPAIQDGVLYIGSSDGYLYALR